jgi:hypothetical protein
MATAFDKRLDQERAAADRFPDRVVIRDPAETELPEIVAVVVAEEAPAATPQPRIRPWGPLLLAVYNLIAGAAIVVAIGAILTRWIIPVLPAGDPAAAANQAEAAVRFLALTALGSGFGAVIHNLLGLHVHYAVVGDFQPRFSGSYVLGPFGAAGLGFTLFVILQSGLFALGGDVAKPEDALRASLFYVAIGILTGLAWDTIILRLDAIARQLFGGEGSSLARNAVDRARRPPPASEPDEPRQPPGAPSSDVGGR